MAAEEQSPVYALAISPSSRLTPPTIRLRPSPAPPPRSNDAGASSHARRRVEVLGARACRSDRTGSSTTRRRNRQDRSGRQLRSSHRRQVACSISIAPASLDQRVCLHLDRLSAGEGAKSYSSSRVADALSGRIERRDIVIALGGVVAILPDSRRNAAPGDRLGIPTTL